MANQVTLRNRSTAVVAKTNTVGNPLICSTTNTIAVRDILNEINNQLGRIDTIENTVNVFVARKDIKTRRVGNILYMTDNGTNP